MSLLAFAAGVVLGAWAGFRLWPRTVAEPARLYGGDLWKEAVALLPWSSENDWTTVTVTGNPPNFTIGPKHPLQ